MNTNKDSKISIIINQFLSNRYSVATEEKIQKWLIEDQFLEEKEEASLAYWNSLEAKADKSTYRALKKVKEKIGFTDNSRRITIFWRLSRVAAVLLPLFLIAAISYYYVHTPKEKLVEIYVPYGEKKQLILSDGSVISLNSGTTFRYPQKFGGKIRSVNLIGEAYFIVAKDTLKPFIVKTNHLSVKVLGTRFNVKAYSNDNRTITTLNSGKIEVITSSQKSCILKPNQQLTLTNSSSDIVINNVFAEGTIGWNNGQLIFINCSFDEILRTLERHFNVTFITDPDLSRPSEFYTVKFLKNEDLDQILNVLKDVVGDYLYQKQGNNVLLRRAE